MFKHIDVVYVVLGTSYVHAKKYQAEYKNLYTHISKKIKNIDAWPHTQVKIHHHDTIFLIVNYWFFFN